MNVGQLIGEAQMRIAALEARLAVAPAPEPRKVSVRKGSTRDRIVEYVRNSVYKVSMKEIALDLDIGISTTIAALLKLVHEGVLVREGTRRHYRYGLAR